MCVGFAQNRAMRENIYLVEKKKRNETEICFDFSFYSRRPTFERSIPLCTR